ncbi:MAG: Holliday junction resolvase RuvX [Acidobacteria bacterium]|nr:Holliday junction resolvase RuvX [Acidobacteriota bacterium]
MPSDSSYRILGIDYGQKRVGLSLSDPLLLTAQPFETVEYKNKDDLFAHINKVIEDKSVHKIVVGIPITLRDTISMMGQEVSEFVKILQEKHPQLEIITWDERLSSAQAEKVMLQGGATRKERKKNIDKLAASIMLQSYLDFINSMKSLKHEVKE